VAFSEVEVENLTSFGKKWRIFANIGNFMYVMVRNANGVVSYAPLFIHRFQFLRPHFLADSEKFNTTELDELKTTADKLRYHRYKKGLLQRDVADHVGIERTTYHDYEANERDYYSLEILGQIAGFLEVELADLLGDYNTFLYNGQAQQLKALRKQLGLTQKAFAKQIGVNPTTYKRWEWGQARMTKNTWEKIFRA
jgi:transcriptional regulator with XRE-family HTH domain